MEITTIDTEFVNKQLENLKKTKSVCAIICILCSILFFILKIIFRKYYALNITLDIILFALIYVFQFIYNKVFNRKKYFKATKTEKIDRGNFASRQAKNIIAIKDKNNYIDIKNISHKLTDLEIQNEFLINQINILNSMLQTIIEK